MRRFATMLVLLCCSLATLPAFGGSGSASGVRIDAPRKEWRGKIKARPVKSEAQKLAVSLDAAQPLALETFTVALEPYVPEVLALDVALEQHESEAQPWSLSFAADFEATRRAIERMVLHQRHPAAIGSRLWKAAEELDYDFIELHVKKENPKNAGEQ